MTSEIKTHHGLKHYRFAVEDTNKGGINPKELLTGFHELYTSFSAATVAREWQRVLEGEGPTHFWPDTGYFITPNPLHGIRNGVVLQPSQKSFLYACLSGLTMYNPEYEEVYRTLVRIIREHESSVERFLCNQKVSVIQEIIDELEEGANKVNATILLRDNMHPTYIKMMNRQQEKRKRLIGRLKELQQNDDVHKKLDDIVHNGMAAYCKDMAETKGITTSHTDNALISYVIANSMVAVGEWQTLITGDGQMMKLAMEVIRSCTEIPLAYTLERQEKTGISALHVRCEKSSPERI